MALVRRAFSEQNWRMTQHRFFQPAMAILLLAPLPSQAQEFQRIETAEAFVEQVVGKPLTWATGETIIRADGTTSGKMQNVGTYEGAWTWRDGQYCRSLIVNGQTGEEKCLLVAIAGDTLRMSYDQGDGRALDLAIRDALNDD